MGGATKKKSRRIGTAPSKRKASSKSLDKSSNMWASNKSKKKRNSFTGIDEVAAAALFAEIADEDDENAASMEGISKIADKLDIDACADIRILVLMYKMGATDQPATITKDEWMHGCSKLQLDSWEAFRKHLPALDTGFMCQSEFKDFYKFCFQFNREGTHKTLDKELVVGLLELVLQGRVDADRLSSYCDFLTNSKAARSYTRITADQWTSFLDFCHECEDLSVYDESTSAWPVLIDEYVEHMLQLSSKKK